MIETPLIRHFIREPWQTDTVIALGRNDGPDYALHDALLEAGCPKQLTLALIRCPLLVTISNVWFGKYWTASDHPIFESDYLSCILDIRLYGSLNDLKMEFFYANFSFRIPPRFTMDLCYANEKIIQSWLKPHFDKLSLSYLKHVRPPNIPDSMLG
jgi:hypothetical protein